MAEPQNPQGIRDLLDSISQGITDRGVTNGDALARGAVVATIKAIQFILEHVESLEARIAALESRSR